MTDLQTLLDRDPMEYNDQDIDTIIEELRKMRHTFQLTAKPAKLPKLDTTILKGKIDL